MPSLAGAEGAQFDVPVWLHYFSRLGERWVSAFASFCLLASSVSNFHADTRGGGDHFFRLTCSVVLWGGRNTANITVMWGSAPSVSATLDLPPLTACVLSKFTLFRLCVALPGTV